MLAYLLPYVEQDNVYKMFFTGNNPVPPDFFAITTNDITSWVFYSSALQAALSHIPTFVCPQDDPNIIPTDGVGLELHIFADLYAGLIEQKLLDLPTDSTLGGGTVTVNDLGRTNYMGVAGYFGRASKFLDATDYEGLMCNRSNISLARVADADGTSNTLMFGESLGGKAVGSRDWFFTWAGCGSLATYYGLPENDSVEWYHFSSYHPGVVNFCFADGSVRPLRRGSDNDTFAKYLAGWHDAQVPDFSLVE